MRSGSKSLQSPNTRRRSATGSVSQAARNTSRGALLRIFIKKGTVRRALCLAASRSSQPSPFCTMSSSSPSSVSEVRTISANNFFFRAPRISAARKRPAAATGSGDRAQRKTSAQYARLRADHRTQHIMHQCIVIRPVRHPIQPHEENSSNSLAPSDAVCPSKRKTAKIFSSSTRPEKSSSAAFTTNGIPGFLSNPVLLSLALSKSRAGTQPQPFADPLSAIRAPAPLP